jgi:hypothetical protein
MMDNRIRSAGPIANEKKPGAFRLQRTVNGVDGDAVLYVEPQA